MITHIVLIVLELLLMPLVSNVMLSLAFRASDYLGKL